MSEGCQKAIDTWVAKFPKAHQRSAVLMALRLAQDEYGYVDEVVIRAVASYLDLPLVQVSEVAAFYTMYRTKKCGKYRLAVCNSISCMLCGSKRLIGQLECHLNIKLGGMTEDGLFSLHETECLAACSMAPALIVNDETYHYNVDEAKAHAIIKALREADHGA
jgi:NADH-quinone oxidoreductase subunit E